MNAWCSCLALVTLAFSTTAMADCGDPSKQEGMDFDGSVDPQSFKRTSWSKIIAAVNNGNPLGGLSAGDLQAILDSADTAEGSIQLRNNARPN